MEKATKKQLAVLTYIKLCIKSNNYQPTVDEMAQYFKMTVQAICDKLKALEKKGYIKQTGKARAIEIL